MTDPSRPADRALKRLRGLEAEAAKAREEAERAIIAAHDAGVTWAALAEATGEPITTLKWFAVRSQPHVRASQERIARKRASSNAERQKPGPRSAGQGYSVAEWADMQQVTPQAIYAILRRPNHNLDVVIDERGRRRILGRLGD